METGKSIKNRVLAVFVSIAMIFTMTPAALMMSTSEADADSAASGKNAGTVLGYVYFGSYPQREVVSKASDSGVYKKVWATENDYIVDSKLYAQLCTSENWDAKDDISIGNNKYHRLKKSGATFSKSGDSFYYDWSDSTTYHYFKYEPIKWRVLEKSDDKAFLLAETGLDNQRYNTSNKGITWEESSIRSWLNGYGSPENEPETDFSIDNFLDRAFTEDEQVAINTTTVKNKNNLRYGTKGGNDTQDKVFLLSESEVYTENAVKYGFISSGDSNDKSREVKSSTYAKAMGVYSNTDSGFLGNSCWWLRSPGAITCFTAYITCSGYVYSRGEIVDYYNNTVRPALYLNLKYTHLYTPAQTGSLTREVNYNLIKFGHYPQTEVVSQASDSGVFKKVWATENDYIVDSELYTRLRTSAKWDENNDTKIGDDKYHRMIKPSTKSSGENYYDWSDSKTYHYFKYEPIMWRVLEKNGDDAFLLAETALDAHKYNNSRESVTWETCSLRSWLNGAFLNRAFTADEQAIINTTTVENKNNLLYGIKGGNNTQDKLFLLSESETYTDNAVKYGFNPSHDVSDKARQSKSSTYAKAMGAYANIYRNALGNCHWWLRSPGCDVCAATYVFQTGSIIFYGDTVQRDYYAVRPALHLNLSTADPESAGKTGIITTMNISKADISRDTVVFRNKEITPKVSVAGLREGYDYEVEYSDNDKVGIATITVTGKGDWTGTITKSFAIVNEMDISEMDITLPNIEYCYTGSPVCPEVMIEGLEEGTDFDVVYENNNQAGTAKVIATGKDGYVGSIEKTFTIYNHDYHHVTDKAKIGIPGKSYDECSHCHNVINQKTIKALNPAATRITAIKGGKQSFTAKWAKKAYTGYQLRYSLKSSMESAKTITITKASTVTKKITKIKAKKKYYVQVRTYKTVNGEKFFSRWSTKKAVRTK